MFFICFNNTNKGVVLMYKKQIGLTLIESLMALSVVGAASGFVLSNQMEKSKEINSFKMINDISSIINAVDHRIAIDGYDSLLWSKTKWDNEKEVVSELLSKELVSIGSACKNGTWTPSVLAERETSLIKCNLWLDRQGIDLNIEAKINLDDMDYIQNFEMFLNFNDIDSFESNFINIKNALKNNFAYNKREVSGMHEFSFVDSTSKNIISIKSCMDAPLDCSIRAAMERSGGYDYLRSDGSNSVIGQNLDFVETKGQSPMKCVRWSNTNRDGSGNWSQVLVEDCGIGIYKKNAVVVDVVADTGTFKSVVLDKECIVYEWNGLKVVDNGAVSPCGLTNDGSEVYQTIESTMANTATFNEMYVTNGFVNKAMIKSLKVNLANIDNILTEKINVKNITVKDILDIKGDVYLDRVVFEGETIFNDEIYFNNDVMFKKEIDFKNKNIDVKSSVNVTKDLIVKNNTNFVKDLGLTNNIEINGSLKINNLLNINEKLNVIKETDIKGASTLNNLIISEEIDDITKLNAKKENVGTKTAVYKMSSPIGDFDNIKAEFTLIKKEITEIEEIIKKRSYCNSKSTIENSVSSSCPSGQIGETIITNYYDYYWNASSKSCDSRKTTYSMTNCASSGVGWCYIGKRWVSC